MTQYYLRQGECNWCGQCCGSGYAYGGEPPLLESPWPTSWPEGIRTWSEEALIAHFPVRSLIKTADLATKSGTARWRGQNFNWIFVDGYSLVQDDAPYSDPSSFTPRCPFLVLNGEASNPPTQCGVAESAVFIDHCSKLPPDRISEAQKAQWEAAFPACSYQWVIE